ncbi:18225_t:CDS:2, partial [Funneliformis geosporum]
VLHCQELLVKLRQINDYKEVISIAHVDSHYYANGMKGIETRRPIIGLDFISLYPSLIMAYNLSPVKIILTYGESVRHDNQFEKKGLFPVVLEDLFNMRASNSKSPIFLRELAGGITLVGKYNLNLIAEFITKKGFRIKYGDTNSLYLTCPDKYYEKYDEAFSRKDLSKKVYWTKMVKITMNVMKSLCDQVNAYLGIKNGTSYLKMTYEEVLFPIYFTGKKKYFGVPHKEVVNFRSDDLFMKGIDTVKQENSELF